MARVALVTGAAQGIGHAIAAALLDREMRVVMADVNGEANRAAALALDPSGEHAIPVELDLRDAAATAAIVHSVVASQGSLDVLVNNAGVTSQGSLWDLEIEAWDDVIDTNLRATFILSRAAGLAMRQTGWGRIVNLASLAGQTARPTGVPYSASKAGIIALTRVFALELAGDGITVNAIAPGVTATPMLQTVDAEIVDRLIAQIPVGRVALPEDIAELVGFLVSDHGASVTGATYDINGGALMR
jgi:3-oxoacyl-[acyl-carrier protein] reductase